MCESMILFSGILFLASSIILFIVWDVMLICMLYLF